MSNNSVTDIVSDKSGGLWIATWDGLNFYDGNKFTVYKEELDKSNSIIGNMVVKLLKDKKNTIWALTDRSVCAYLGNHKFKNYLFKETPSALFLSESGQLTIKIKNAFYQFKDGKFYFTKKKQTETLDTNGSLKKILYSKYPDVIINDVLRDAHGSIWYATRRNGLYIIPNTASNLNNNYIEHYAYDLYSPYSFNSNEIEKLFQDDFGNVWLGHKDGGLSMSYKGSELITTVVPHPEKNPHLPNETIRAITLDPGNAIWIGYYNQGLYYYSNSAKCYQKYPIAESKLNTNWDRVRSLFTSSEGSIWVGTYAGLIRIKNGKYTLYEQGKLKHFPVGRNYSIYEDHKEQLWIACWGGLAKFNLKTAAFEPFVSQALFNKIHIRKVEVYNNQVVIGTENSGLIILDLTTGKIKKITTANGILGNSVYSLYKDSKTNYFWIATLGGISVYDLAKNQIVKNITENEGLPSHMVYGLMLNNNSFWVSTTKGIATIDRNNYKVTSFNPHEGWQGAEFSEGAYYQDKKGMLFFGGISGLNYFQPSSMSFNKTFPKLKITIDDDENYGTRLVKEYSKNSLKLGIIPISFTDYSNNNVLYKLVGYDDDWKKLQSLTPIQYKDLPPGDYKLLVKNQYEQKSKGDVKLQLTIRSPFYGTFWFSIFLVLLVLIGIIYLVIQKNRSVLRYQEKLEKQIQERTEIINQQKNNLIVNNKELDEKNREILIQKEKLLKIHHNLKNQDFEIDKFKIFVLSEFQDPLYELIESLNKIQDNQSVRNQLLAQSGRLLNLISEWNYLDFAKDIGNQKMVSVYLFPVIKGLINGLKLNLEKVQINLNYKIDNAISWVEIDVLRFKLFFQYMFNDIIKYSESGSDIGIDIVIKEEKLKISIRSNSTVLKNNFYNVNQYSPYFKASQVLITDMEASFKAHNEGEYFEIVVAIPINVIDQSNIAGIEAVFWKHLELENHLSADKNNILILSQETDFSMVKQLLDNSENNLIFESNEAALSSAIRHVNIDVLVLYNMAFTNLLIDFLNTINEENSRINIPVIYISERIDYSLHEQTIEMGIDSVIQLPASASYIQKRILKLLNNKKESSSSDKPKFDFFNFTIEDCNVLSPNEKLIKKGLEIIKEELHNPSFNVEALFEQLEISRIKCYRIFKEVLKQSPSDVIISLRLQKAEILLKNKNLNISEISFECGFNDPKYFSRMFKKHFGTSPKTFRNNTTQSV
ncbi:two-component regulator propeller domain-containing protein [Flavobacterium granuli]|uniref:two-component regulator propeller domain-containing protein n=1 Tax=Flavobacterium granuli TaxID=280093 RepID=UPI001474D51D|nr:two-component regulator propeller domain-containing protein [Flavobacterium granuli]